METQINIKRLVDNISNVNVYTPIIEAVVNSIDAIEEAGESNGKIEIKLIRNKYTQSKLEGGAVPEIQSIVVEDNGVGFNEENFIAFNKIYTEKKVEKGGKGFGRFAFLKYYQEACIQSIYKEGSKYKKRSFNFVNNDQIIQDLKVEETNLRDTGTVLILKNLQSKGFDKTIETIARKLVENLLVYFALDNFNCPQITISDEDESGSVILNDFIGDDREIIEIEDSKFILESLDKKIKEEFHGKVFKVLYSGTGSSINLAADNRQVTETMLHEYIPEFKGDFFDNYVNKKGEITEKNYSVKVYIQGNYLDSYVSPERGGFKFNKEKDLFHPFSQSDIEKYAAKLARETVKEEIHIRSEKKIQQIRNYVNEKAPWHKTYLESLDYSTIPLDVDDEHIETLLEKERFKLEKLTRNKINVILNDDKQEIDGKIKETIKNITEISKNELAHYVALRRCILDLLRKKLELNEGGKYDPEADIHNLIFPTKSNSDTVRYDMHNLWVLDERLSFTEFVSSDESLNGGKSERTDVLIFNKKMAYRLDNEESNPIIIFEFKKPQRDDFVNESAKEDPIEQIIRYVNDIRDGKFKTPKGRDIFVNENTPFYGIVVCDFTEKVKKWIMREKDFKPMPDGQGYFKWHGNNNLYMEIISWDKLLKDAEMRNKIFFKKLGII